MLTLMHRLFAVALLVLCASLPVVATASTQGKVIISRECDYVLLDSPQGQILIKVIKGERPKAGDTLTGKLERGFSKLTNQRTGEVMQVWVDQVDSGGTRALMRYGQYCN